MKKSIRCAADFSQEEKVPQPVVGNPPENQTPVRPDYSAGSSKFHASGTPFRLIREKDRIIVSNQYVRCVHDLRQGGELTEAVILNGSGKNLLAKPQSTIVGIIEKNKYHSYSSAEAPVEKFSLETENGNPVLQFDCILADPQGKPLEHLKLRRRVEYTPWGEALHRVTLNASRKIEELGMIQIGTLYPARRMDTLAVLPSRMEMPGAYKHICRWYRLDGQSTQPFCSRWLPNSMLVFQRGADGFQYVRGDRLDAWDDIGGKLPGYGLGYFDYREDLNAYEMRFSPVDCLRKGQYLQGEKNFEFSLAFPFVKENIVPLASCSANLLQNARGFADRWPQEADYARWQAAGIDLMRIHNDGDSFDNGIFWRATVYPPYPPDEMKKMDQTLELARRHQINVVPYFSLHEYHPDADGFKENARKWGWIAGEGDDIVPTRFRNSIFGYLMCLQSGWLEKRKASIGEVLSRHAFSGVYYDWCIAIECFNHSHGPHHWDYRKLIELLEWTLKRIGPAGHLYLHLTNAPNIAAENMASLVLTDEASPKNIRPGMFSPHAHFLNICPRQVCLMIPAKSPEKDLLRYAMCALLEHAAVSSGHEVFARFYQEYAEIIKRCGEYRRHTAPGEGRCRTSDQQTVGMSAYWNDSEAMLVFANLKEQPATVKYCFDPDAALSVTGEITVPPLKIRTLTIKLEPERHTNKKTQ